MANDTVETKQPQDASPKLITELLAGMLQVEKRFAHELTGVRDQRRKELRDLINKFVAEKLERQ